MYSSEASPRPRIVHFHAWHQGGLVELEWETRPSVLTTWRVLRSRAGFAECADPRMGWAQELVAEGDATHVTDWGVLEGVVYYYTVFVSSEGGKWRRAAEAKLKPGSRLHWFAAS